MTRYNLPQPSWITRHEGDLDALIAAGWGDTNPADIPANWREVTGPDSDLGTCGKVMADPQRCLGFAQREQRERRNKVQRELRKRHEEARQAGIVLPSHSRAGGFKMSEAERAKNRDWYHRRNHPHRPQQMSGDLFEMGVAASV